VFHTDFRRDADLFGAAAHQFGKSGRRHGASYADFALATHFGAGNRGIHFV